MRLSGRAWRNYPCLRYVPAADRGASIDGSGDEGFAWANAMPMVGFELLFDFEPAACSHMRGGYAYPVKGKFPAHRFTIACVGDTEIPGGFPFILTRNRG